MGGTWGMVWHTLVFIACSGRLEQLTWLAFLQRCFLRGRYPLSVTKTEISPLHTILDVKTCVTFLSVCVGEFDKCSALNSTRSIPPLWRVKRLRWINTGVDDSQYLSEGRKEKGGEEHIVGNLLLVRSFLETYILANLSSMLEVSGMWQKASWQPLTGNRPWFWTPVLSGKRKNIFSSFKLWDFYLEAVGESALYSCQLVSVCSARLLSECR